MRLGRLLQLASLLLLWSVVPSRAGADTVTVAYSLSASVSYGVTSSTAPVPAAGKLSLVYPIDATGRAIPGPVSVATFSLVNGFAGLPFTAATTIGGGSLTPPGAGSFFGSFALGGANLGAIGSLTGGGAISGFLTGALAVEGTFGCIGTGSGCIANGFPASLGTPLSPSIAGLFLSVATLAPGHPTDPAGAGNEIGGVLSFGAIVPGGVIFQSGFGPFTANEVARTYNRPVSIPGPTPLIQLLLAAVILASGGSLLRGSPAA